MMQVPTGDPHTTQRSLPNPRRHARTRRRVPEKPLSGPPIMEEPVSPPLPSDIVSIDDNTTTRTDLVPDNPITDTEADTVPKIAVEIVSEEEMSILDAALSAARSNFSASSLSPPQLRVNARSLRSIALVSNRQLSGCSGSGPGSVDDIEDSGGFRASQKRIRANESLLRRFRRKRGLSVTDITATEWCEKQMEFVLFLGKKKETKAMRAGSARHIKLEEEVVKKVKVRTKSAEDVWAVKFINFIVGVNQLLFEGLTRELPLIGCVDGVWTIGVMDEIQMPGTGTEKNPKLIDTKTRVRATLPAEPQQRNGRLQVMCYKLLWDNLAADNFPSEQFFDFFALNRHYILSEEIRNRLPAQDLENLETLDDLVKWFRSTCSVLPPAHDELTLRYEFQKDHSLLGEDNFLYDSDWLKSQLEGCLEFWSGEREARYTPEEERWKCQFCQFAKVCPAMNRY